MPLSVCVVLEPYAVKMIVRGQSMCIFFVRLGQAARTYTVAFESLIYFKSRVQPACLQVGFAIHF